MAFPSSLRRRNKDLHLVPVVSAPVEVDPSCRYDNLPYFTHFGDSISFVGGINKPKLIQCFDSTGRCHRQLVRHRCVQKSLLVLVQMQSLCAKPACKLFVPSI